MFKFSSTFLLHFIQKRFLNTVSTSTLPLASVSTVEFLTNSCGLSSGSPTSNGRKLQFDEKNIQQYEAVIGFLKSHGLENPQIAKLVSRKPWILQSKVSTNLKPKFEFLQEIGFVGPLLSKLILSNPRIFYRNLDSQLKPSFFFLKEILESDEQVTAAIRHSPWLLISDFKGILKSNIDVLASEGVPSRNIAKLIVSNSRTIMRKVDRMIEVVKTVKELGIEPKAGMFVHALRIRCSVSDSTWKKKINVMKSLGWSETEIFTAFKKDPSFLGCSEEKMRDVADFCFNTAKLDPGSVIICPKIFKCSVDKRLQPRYKVLEVLKVKNLLKNVNIAWVLVQSERAFVKKFVVRHLDEIPNLMDIYRGNVTAETKSVL
ncbi:transcription termination factor MTERF5 [Cucumis melo var. makuwa]|uniref:Transcription termination factor MTERF5 n=1 Tax=Cucumis melo var. makuwa TaxID=1194695 RepID=A0A5D3CWA2_CUCMM|nr:transcription termination factor MTERF5 [Cucumis melo var. makuwa]TYK15745.1 transcription termination factor MTERF5 [Cucumis melo var. makuwa]